MSGVGSTNAMKKGSANNPFLAYSEADMQGFLNSAYTGCIVKYTGPSTKKGIQDVLPLDSAKSLGDAQNLVANLYWAINNDSDYGEVAHPAGGTIRENPWHITVVNKTTGKTQYIQEVKVDTTNKKFVDTSKTGDLAWLLSDWYLSSLNDSLSFQDSLTKNVTVLECENDKSKSGYELLTYWPLEKGWQKSCFNTEGKILLWGYGDTVELSCPVVYYYNRGPFWVEPYVVNELYKVVYGDGQYYFEEFYHINEDVTTAIVEDVAPGKTFYDFTGTKQTGTGTKINPYIATDLNTFKSFPVGSFIKWIGPDKTVLDETTGQTLIQGEVYRAVEDGDVFQYVILPTLSSPADPIDVAEGKEVINQLGAVMIGTGNNILQASTTAGMQALFTDANIGKIAKYVGETDVYIKDAFYLITADASAKQYYELPELTNEGISSDLAQGKELINSKGEKVIGTVSGGVEIITGSITTSSNTLTIAGILRKPKIISMYNNSITMSTEWCGCFSDPLCAVEGENAVAVKWLKGSSGPSRGFVYSYFVYNVDTQTVTFSPTGASFSKSPLDYAIAF